MITTNRRQGLVGPLALLAAAGASPASSEEHTPIERIEPTPAVPGLPSISWAVAQGGLVFVSGVSVDPRQHPGVAEQTRAILARIDELLAKAGTSKSKLLSTTVWLTDMSHFAEHNNAWNEWVDRANPPARACLNSPQLWRPGLLVEIMGTAAR